MKARMFDCQDNSKLQRVKTYTMNEKVMTRLKKSFGKGVDKIEESEDEDRVDDLEKLPRRAGPNRVRRQTMTDVDMRTNNILSPFS